MFYKRFQFSYEAFFVHLFLLISTSSFSKKPNKDYLESYVAGFTAIDFSRLTIQGSKKIKTSTISGRTILIQSYDNSSMYKQFAGNIEYDKQSDKSGYYNKLWTKAFGSSSLKGNLKIKIGDYAPQNLSMPKDSVFRLSYHQSEKGMGSFENQYVILWYYKDNELYACPLISPRIADRT